MVILVRCVLVMNYEDDNLFIDSGVDKTSLFSEITQF